jgi:hypothetical protein
MSKELKRLRDDLEKRQIDEIEFCLLNPDIKQAADDLAAVYAEYSDAVEQAVSEIKKQFEDRIIAAEEEYALLIKLQI